MPSRRRRDQRGQSLVEVVIAILLLSTVMLVIAMGLFTINRATVGNERVQSVDAALAVYGEVLRSTINYRPCRPGFDPTTATPGYMDDTLVYLESPDAADNLDGWLKPPAVIVEVEYGSLQSWDPETDSFVDECSVPDTGAQQITYQVTYDPDVLGRDGDPVTRTGQIVKRRDGPS